MCRGSTLAGSRCHSGPEPPQPSLRWREEQPTAGPPGEEHEEWRPAEGPVGLCKQRGWAVAPRSESWSLSPHSEASGKSYLAGVTHILKRWRPSKVGCSRLPYFSPALCAIREICLVLTCSFQGALENGARMSLRPTFTLCTSSGRAGAHSVLHTDEVSAQLTRTENKPSPVSYTHLTLPTILGLCRSRWSPYH